jgi:hypothetical protein
VGLIAVVLTAEAATRVAATRLPDPQEYVTPKAQTMVGDMERLQRAGVRSDAVLVGTSMVGRGFSPRTLREDLGFEWVHNFALEGSQATLIRRWLLEEIVPRLAPRRVVWGVSTLDFNGNRPAPLIDQYDAARATRDGLLGEADRVLGSTSAIARDRAILRDPEALARALKAGTRPRRAAPLRTLRAADPPPLVPRPQLVGDGVIDFIRRDMLAGFAVTDAELDAFRTTLLDLRRQGIETAVVVMPVSSTYIKAHPRGRADYDAWRRAVTRAAAGTGATLLDLHDSRADTDFPDNVHLSPEVAPDFTRVVAARLAAEGWGHG